MGSCSMTRAGNSARRRVDFGQIALVISCTLLGSFAVCTAAVLRINSSPSLPIGLYITSADKRANLVEFCPPVPFAAMAIARGYRSAGACPDGATPLLKPVVAVPGDVVELSNSGVAVNGNLLSNTAPLCADSKGRALTHWPFGRYTVPSGTVWVASSYSSRSFDSRYFGPIKISVIRGHLESLWTIDQ
jgi:conjugative transfer signal peptidase TraF